jgi:type II secretory pathway pseudopilin PulG
MTLIETIVALTILATIAVVFLGGLSVSTKATITADEHATAESIARGQMEWAQRVDYVENATQYLPADIPDISDYQDYSVNITAAPLHTPDDGIQKITVTVLHKGDYVIALEGYKRE